MGQNITVTGMVLQVMPVGDYDKRITILTKERGKITAFARGARRQNSPFLAATNPFSFGKFELFEGRSSYTVAKASIQNYFRELAKDYNATYYGFYFLEFADYCCQENNDEREMLKLLYQSLRAISSSAYDNRLVRVIFELKAAAINGTAPNVFCCTDCGREDALTYFSVRKSAVLCDACGKKALAVPKEGMFGYSGQYRLTESVLYTMQYVISARIEKLYTFAVSEEVLVTLQKIMKDYFLQYMGHTFKTLKVIEDAQMLLP